MIGIADVTTRCWRDMPCARLSRMVLYSRTVSVAIGEIKLDMSTRASVDFSGKVMYGDHDAACGTFKI